jgi:hypothetical protein
LTVCVSELDVLPAKLALPLYIALIECEPTASDEIVSVADAWALRLPVR